jgi:two-component system nitrate/nitrite response regulator NarL
MERFNGSNKITRRQTRSHAPLTVRERQIVLALSDGLTNKEIAKRLRLAEGTVNVHLHHIYRKLGIANRTALAVRANNQTL